MVSSYYTLRYLANDLDGKLRGSEIAEAFCQTKNELLLVLRSQPEDRCLTISCDPSMNAVFLRSPVHRAKKNSIDVFKPLWSHTVQRVAILPADRELVFACSGDLRLHARLFGSKANVFLVDSRDIVLDAFLTPKEYRGATLPVQPAPRTTHRWTAEEFRDQLRSIGTILLPAALKKILPLLSTTLIREICFRAGVGEQQLVAELSDEMVGRLFSVSQILVDELESPPGARVYFESGMPLTFSIVPLRHLNGMESEVFDSVHDAIRLFMGKSRKHKSVLQEKETLLHFLRQGEEKAERTLLKMEKETEALQRAMQYERLGKLLMTNLAALSKGMKEVELEDVYRQDRSRLLIKLDQKLTPPQNAEYYFDKAKKARAGVDEKLGRQEDVRDRWESFRDLIGRLSELHSPEQLTEFVAAYRDQLAKLGWKETEGGTHKDHTEPPFRTFVVAGGFQVWVGKNSENNDLLTLKYARPVDLWFHTRGSSGSHVVLRMGTGKGEPSKRALEEAAGIAAFYSKMRTAKHVPVAMTEKKYVRKPRGAPAGTVIIEREKLLFVNPKLPSADTETR